MNAIDIIQETPVETVGRLLKTDERGRELLRALEIYLRSRGLAMTPDDAVVLLELTRTPYYLGYQRHEQEAALAKCFAEREG